MIISHGNWSSWWNELFNKVPKIWLSIFRFSTKFNMNPCLFKKTFIRLSADSQKNCLGFLEIQTVSITTSLYLLAQIYFTQNSSAAMVWICGLSLTWRLTVAHGRLGLTGYLYSHTVHLYLHYTLMKLFMTFSIFSLVVHFYH